MEIRYFSKERSVVEFPPFKRSIAVSNRAYFPMRENTQYFLLSFPYTYFITKHKRVGFTYYLENLWVLFSPTRIDINNMLYTLPLPNITPDGYVCLGGVSLIGAMRKKEFVNAVASYFWQSAFSGDTERLEKWRDTGAMEWWAGRYLSSFGIDKLDSESFLKKLSKRVYNCGKL